MKCICYNRLGRVEVESVNPDLIAQMMGQGMANGRPPDDVSETYIDRETAKFLIETAADAAAFKAGWEAFLAPRRGTPRELACRAFHKARVYGGLSEDETWDCLAKRLMPPDTQAVAIMDDSLLPPQIRVDRYFRNAVVWDDSLPNKMRCDMAKARDIHMGHIRRARDVELAGLDLLFMRAIETGNGAEQRRVAELKQTLRDLPQTFDLTVYLTPEALKAAWPVQLPPRAPL